MTSYLREWSFIVRCAPGCRVGNGVYVGIYNIVSHKVNNNLDSFLSSQILALTKDDQNGLVTYFDSLTVPIRKPCCSHSTHIAWIHVHSFAIVEITHGVTANRDDTDFHHAKPQILYPCTYLHNVHVHVSYTCSDHSGDAHWSFSTCKNSRQSSLCQI